MAEKQSKVTRAEWDVLEVLWGKSPLSAREVFDHLPEACKGSLQTVRTLLERLLAKGVVRRFDVHGIFVFAPESTRDEVVRDEGKNFLRRFFDGQAALGAAYFIENEDLPEEELMRLKKLLDNKLKEAKDE